MKKPVFVCFVVLLSLVLFSCATKPATLEVFVSQSDDSIIIIQNTGDANCTIFVQWASGEQQFDLATGQSITLGGVQKPVEVSAISSRDN